MTYAIVPATEEHIRAILPRIGEADARECWAAAHLTPEAAVRLSMEATRLSLAGLAEDVPFCLFGVSTYTALSLRGVPWLFGTEDLTARHAIAFARGSRRVVHGWRQEHHFLANYVDARHAVAIRWLRWLEFTLDPPQPYGPDGLAFHYFHWEV